MNRATVLEILGRAIDERGIEDLAAWLISPRPEDGRTPTEALRAGDYDRARQMAVTTTTAEDARRKRRQDATGGSYEAFLRGM